MLRGFGFGRVMTAEHGAEAVEYFKTLHGNPQMRASLGLDIVISDLIMTPIDGLLLLRWMRTAKESPDRFVPIIMLSGAADHDYVNQARDLGSTEFLAKPLFRPIRLQAHPGGHRLPPPVRHHHHLFRPRPAASGYGFTGLR